MTPLDGILLVLGVFAAVAACAVALRLEAANDGVDVDLLLQEPEPLPRFEMPQTGYVADGRWRICDLN